MAPSWDENQPNQRIFPCKIGWNPNFQPIPQEVQADQTLPIGNGSRESFIWIILKTILCLVLDFQGSILRDENVSFREGTVSTPWQFFGEGGNHP